MNFEGKSNKRLDANCEPLGAKQDGFQLTTIKQMAASTSNRVNDISFEDCKFD